MILYMNGVQNTMFTLLEGHRFSWISGVILNMNSVVPLPVVSLLFESKQVNLAVTWVPVNV